MAIVQADVQVEVTSIPDGRYLIKNRAPDVYWCTDYTRSSWWVGAELTTSEVASALAIDPSGWRVLLVSLNSTHLQGEEDAIFIYQYYFFQSH